MVQVRSVIAEQYVVYRSDKKANPSRLLLLENQEGNCCIFLLLDNDSTDETNKVQILPLHEREDCGKGESLLLYEIAKDCLKNPKHYPVLFDKLLDMDNHPRAETIQTFLPKILESAT